MAVIGCKLMDLTRSKENRSDEFHRAPLEKTQRSAPKLNILKPRMRSADITLMEWDVQRNSGQLAQDCLITIGVDDIEQMANAQKMTLTLRWRKAGLISF